MVVPSLSPSLTKNIKKLLLCVTAILSGHFAQSQVVYSVEYSSDADVKVYVSKYRSEADLIVYKTTYKSDADENKGIWFFTEYKSDADKKIYFCEYSSCADLVIYFSEYKSDAEWKDRSKMHLMY